MKNKISVVASSKLKSVFRSFHRSTYLHRGSLIIVPSVADFITHVILSQDEVRDPRQVLARPTWVADRGVRCDRPQWSGKNLGRAFRLANGNFSPFGLVNTHILVCSVWPIPIFWSVRSGQYPYSGLFGLANTQTSACSVWPTPKFRSVRSDQYPYFGLFGLASTHISVCSVWPIPKFRSVRSDQYPYFGLFGLANTYISVCSVWPVPIFWSVWSGQYLISRPWGPAK